MVSVLLVGRLVGQGCLESVQLHRAVVLSQGCLYTPQKIHLFIFLEDVLAMLLPNSNREVMQSGASTESLSRNSKFTRVTLTFERGRIFFY